MSGVPLLVGDVCVDFSLPTISSGTKMRLGGIAHAARALWATDTPYAVAAVIPSYLVSDAEHYLSEHGCTEFIWLGEVTGAPNVVIIGDVKEVGHQGYEDVLRDRRTARPLDKHAAIGGFADVIVFPGSLDLDYIMGELSGEANVTMDVAYDVSSPERLRSLSGRLSAAVISTSSELFESLAKDNVEDLVGLCREIGAKHLLLKENRGGSRLFHLDVGKVDYIPAVLDVTANSVGVGDAFTAVFGTLEGSPADRAWRGMQVATAYSQTTFPDDFKADVQRQFKLSVETVRGLGGTQLPWHERPAMEIYLAAPDFSYIEKHEIDTAVAALKYHNFSVRRPIQENGEAPLGTKPDNLRMYYSSDVELLRNCSAVFAIPLERDPGTLVEIGLAIEMGIPVITFDPRKENNNTMVICGSVVYSADLDICLNGLFTSLSALRSKQ